MISLFSYTQKEYSEKIFSLFGKGRQQATALYKQWYRQGSFDPSELKETQAQKLVASILNVTSTSLPPIAYQKTEGETSKFLLEFVDGLKVESVIVPMKFGYTLCLSSQVGCAKACSFCQTGRMGLLRSLSRQEIVSQYIVARFVLKIPIDNIVFMGMGEPFDNYEEVIGAIAILTDPSGVGLGPSRITVSTSGCVDYIYKFARDVNPAVNLAVSINAPDDHLRSKLMPVNLKWNLADLKKAIDAYSRVTQKAVFAEYILIHGVNDSIEHANRLADYLTGLSVKINLIPYNAQVITRWSPSTEETQEKFQAVLKSRGYLVFLRRHKGRDIMAACGQLGSVATKLVQS